MNEFPAFSQVHVISDIHMGGAEKNFQVLRETSRLAGYIRWVSRQAPEKPVALVLNGDVFDTLAEQSTDYLMIERAVQVVEQIMANPSFIDVWQALADFVALPHRHLVFVIGNHDIEMAFAIVQRAITQRLAGADLLKHARIEFSTTGAGFSCYVGTSRVYCTHGNEVDSWNFNRYEDLARVNRRLNAGASFAANDWQPNAGTRMVKEVMNQVKQRYKWIDLLKPETEAAVGALLALDPSMLSKITDLTSIFGRKTIDSRQINQRLAFAPDPVSAAATGPTSTSVQHMLGPQLRQSLQQTTNSALTVDDMLLQAELAVRDGVSDSKQPDGQLGYGQLVIDRLTGWLHNTTKDEALRKALLDWLAKDKTFDISDQDQTYQDVVAAAGSQIDFFVTGHTHLERAIEISPGRYYFNCGTWIRLLRLTTEMLKDQASFAPIYQILQDGRMETIDAARIAGQPFVLDQTSAVRISQTPAGTEGALLHIISDGQGAPETIKSWLRP